MNTPNQNQKWDADDYHQHSSIQLEASLDLLNEIKFDGHEHILDIGCGDGKITSIISKLIPKGKILGIDLSDEMISFANEKFSSKDYTNLTFMQKDANIIEFNNEFDIVFASFSLHWITDFTPFMSNINSTLKKNGTIIFTIPLGISDPLDQATKELIQHPYWSDFFINYTEPYPYSKIKTYKTVTADSGFEFSLFREVNHKKIFDSRASLEDYIFQWYPFLNYIAPANRKKFFKNVIDRYLEIEPPRADGSVAFK